jgi:hypothetical protein
MRSLHGRTTVSKSSITGGASGHAAVLSVVVCNHDADSIGFAPRDWLQMCIADLRHYRLCRADHFNCNC